MTIGKEQDQTSNNLKDLIFEKKKKLQGILLPMQLHFSKEIFKCKKIIFETWTIKQQKNLLWETLTAQMSH